MEVDKQPNLDDWSDFAGDYLKAEYIVEFPAKIVCIGVDGLTENGKAKLIANVEYNNRPWKFDLNKTNQNFVKSEGLSPRQMIGKVIIVQKTKVMNPSIKKLVDSLIIIAIEK